MVPFERRFVTCYRHSNFSSIFTRFRDVAAFVLQHATFSYPTSRLPKFPHVPLRVGGWLWATKSECVGLIVRAISFQDFLCDPDPPTSQTDRRTDGRTTCSLNTALCTSASAGKNVALLCSSACTAVGLIEFHLVLTRTFVS